MKALVSAWTFDGNGGGTSFQDTEACRNVPADTPLWMHVARSEKGAAQFLDCIPGTPDTVRKALFAEDTRPRCEFVGDGLLLNLRTANLNPGAEPADMVSLRLWATERRVISLRRRRIVAIQELRRNLEGGQGPKTVGEFVVRLAECMAEQLGPIIEELEDRLDAVEEQEDSGNAGEIADLRKDVVSYRRFIEPQLAALTKLTNAPLNWLSDADRNSLRHTTDLVARQREHLEALRERATILKDIQQSRAAEKMNRTIYFLTIVAGLFLPLSFITGLLGINVGGIPGAEAGTAFWWVLGGMILGAILEILIFKWFKWI